MASCSTDNFSSVSYQCVLPSRAHSTASVLMAHASVSLVASWWMAAVQLVRTWTTFHVWSDEKFPQREDLRPILSSPPFHSAQVFPGQLHLTSLTFEKNMSDRASGIFQKTAAQISAAVDFGLTKHFYLFIWNAFSPSLNHMLILFHSSERPSKISRGINNQMLCNLSEYFVFLLMQKDTLPKVTRLSLNLCCYFSSIPQTRKCTSNCKQHIWQHNRH